MPKVFITILLLIPLVVFAQNSNCIPALTLTGNNSSCLGAMVTIKASVTNPGTNAVFSWKKNNTAVGTNNASFAASDLHDEDIITCTYACTTACGYDTVVTTAPFIVTVLNDFEPVITIANNDPLICEGEQTLFTSAVDYKYGTPIYNWTVNGVPVGNKTTYTTDSLTNGAEVKCLMQVIIPSCADTLYSLSKMNIYVYPMIHPAIKITPTATNICVGEEVTFTATANGGAFPTFTWMINDTATGDTGAALITSKLKDGDSVSCIITIDQDSRCKTTTSAPSNKVGMRVRDFIHPAVFVTSPETTVCAGRPVTFNAQPQYEGDYTYYQWMVNDYYAGQNSPNFTSDKFANGDRVYCSLTTNIPGCSHNETVKSATETVTIKPGPEISFTTPAPEIPFGTAATINATITTQPASVLWKPDGVVVPATALNATTIPLRNDTTLSISITDVNGCTASKEIFIKVLHRVNIPSAFTPNNDGRNDLFRIPKDASIELHEFAVFDRWGNRIFLTKDKYTGWNGTYKSQLLSPGSYVYVIKGIVEHETVIIKGTVTLIR
ncbi:gliding motility-associated C-terminal domain-containing protein [Panacibacter sp. DH6]|uniref:Gliding motility-associated C-terminal domain-containing protein n=1 Tax=Panacibacter microcysteis TaxID=2793269 RepID=A0A931E4U4_9BACT|nr:gliding motility-associated C-terminal domain-containing protein [Panacibacter microcysteis]MBG9375008.1 gliding motility-associated C-terminal domain-containing protein [Panacibacter microcysteis]